jgi:hypothetical protein
MTTKCAIRRHDLDQARLRGTLVLATIRDRGADPTPTPKIRQRRSI